MIVYAGAIVVTFVFVIMLAQQSGATVYDQRSRQPFVATVAAFLLLGALLSTLQVDDARTICIVATGSRRSWRPIRSASCRKNEQLGTMHGLGPVAVWRLFVCGRAGRHAAACGHDWRDCDRAATPPGDAMTGDVERYLAVGAVLFVLGALGFFTRRNLIVMMLSAEMMLHGVSLTLVTFGRVHHNFEGQAFTIFILTVAACEAGLALSLILALYQKSKSLDIEFWTELREAGFAAADAWPRRRASRRSCRPAPMRIPAADAGRCGAGDLGDEHDPKLVDDARSQTAESPLEPPEPAGSYQVGQSSLRIRLLSTRCLKKHSKTCDVADPARAAGGGDRDGAVWAEAAAREEPFAVLVRAGGVGRLRVCAAVFDRAGRVHSRRRGQAAEQQRVVATGYQWIDVGGIDVEDRAPRRRDDGDHAGDGHVRELAGGRVRGRLHARRSGLSAVLRRASRCSCFRCACWCWRRTSCCCLCFGKAWVCAATC